MTRELLPSNHVKKGDFINVIFCARLLLYITQREKINLCINMIKTLFFPGRISKTFYVEKESLYKTNRLKIAGQHVHI